jgi:hypothetical protein
LKVPGKLVRAAFCAHQIRFHKKPPDTFGGFLFLYFVQTKGA